MTYKRDNNDPDRTKAVLSPAEVRRMMGGGDPAADRSQSLSEGVDDRLRAIFSSPTAEELTPTEYERAQAQSAGRCPTCGRAFDCACGDECEFCVDGVPRRAEGEPERYAPASR